MRAPSWPKGTSGKGEGVPQDYEEAVKWYRLAAQRGEAVAQSKLGWMYDNGEGVAQDDKEAVKWYRLAAQQGVGVHPTEIELRVCIALSRSQAIPLNCLREVLRNAFPSGVHPTESELRCRNALRRCEPIPLHRFLIVLRDALPLGVTPAEIELRDRIALLRCEAIPFHRFLMVLRDAPPLGVHLTESGLRIRNLAVNEARALVALLRTWRRRFGCLPAEREGDEDAGGAVAFGGYVA